MRVLIAPDKFAGTLTAVEAAHAIGEGWARRAPYDVLDLVPLSDGGPGFVDVLHASLGGSLEAVTVSGPLGGDVPAAVLLVGDTAYLECAQAVGIHLVATQDRDPLRATSRGVGELLLAAVDLGARKVVVGLGGSGTNDGGAGLLAGLGVDLPDDGPLGLADLGPVDLAPARDRLAGVELVAATDVDNPLLGLTGATKTYGPQKGLADDDLVRVDGLLQRLAEATDRKLAGRPGTGAAGGIGFALMLLGASRVSGLDLVADAVGLPGRTACDLVITGEGSLDFSSAAGKVPYGVAAIAAPQLAPCIVLAGQVHLGARELRAHGIEAAYSVVEAVGEERALGEPAAALADLAERVARTWSR